MALSTLFRTPYQQVVLRGEVLNEVVSTRVTYGFDESVSTAQVTLRSDPGFGGYDDPVTIALGAGNNNVVRFNGLRRDPGFNLEGGYTFQARGHLTRAAEYTNVEDPSFIGGLTIADLVGTPTATGGQVIRAVLDKLGISYVSIGDNGAVFNTQAFDEAFVWSAGTDPQGLTDMQQPGQSGLDYINEYCRVMAVYTTDAAPVGFYKLFETIGGIYCVLIGGRPRATPDHIFTEGVDFVSGRTTRSYPKGNAVLVTGYDFGDGGPDGNGGPEYFFVQGSNDIQGSRRVDVPPFHSRMIEWSSQADAVAGTPTPPRSIRNGVVVGTGMSCETVGNALLADYNRETVNVQARVYTDAVIGIGQTILVQAAGGQVGNLGTGEKLWVRGVTNAYDSQAGGPVFYQDLDLLGGGPVSDQEPVVPVT